MSESSIKFGRFIHAAIVLENRPSPITALDKFMKTKGCRVILSIIIILISVFATIFVLPKAHDEYHSGAGSMVNSDEYLYQYSATSKSKTNKAVNIKNGIIIIHHRDCIGKFSIVNDGHIKSTYAYRILINNHLVHNVKENFSIYFLDHSLHITHIQANPDELKQQLLNFINGSSSIQFNYAYPEEGVLSDCPTVVPLPENTESNAQAGQN